MKRLLLTAAATTLLWSCTKKDNLYQGALPNPQQTANSAGDGKLDLLGFGYDLTGEFANSDWSRFQVLDVTRLQAEKPGYVDVSGAEATTEFFVAGKNAEDYTQQLTIKANVSFDPYSTGTGKDATTAYKGAIDASFSNTNKFSSQYIYASYSRVAVKKGLKLIPDINLLQQYLTPVFTSRLQTASLQDLVHDFGTHVLTNIKLGGEVMVTYQAETRSSDRATAAGAGVKAAYGAVLGLNVNYSQQDKQTNSKEEVRVRTVGGDASKAIAPTTVSFSADGTPNRTFDTSGWSAGITDANAELIKINENGAIPLWAFVADPTKRQALKDYIKQYMQDNTIRLSYDSDPNVNFYSTLDGMGDYAEGGGVALGNLNGNATTDAIFMVYDAPSGPNQFRYQIAYDMSYGRPGSLSGVKYVSGLGDISEGSGVAVADIDRNGVDDIILMAYDAPSGPNEFRYKVGYNLNAYGDATSWSDVKRITGIADASRSAGITFGDINGNGELDIVLMAYDIPSGANQIRYKVGYDVNPQGNVARGWTSTKYTNGMADEINGASVTLTDINNNGILDLVVAVEDNPDGDNQYRYKVGFDINSSGLVNRWSGVVAKRACGWGSDGSGIAFGNLDGNPAKDLILMSIDAPSGPNEIRYKVGFNVSPYDGSTSSWQ